MEMLCDRWCVLNSGGPGQRDAAQTRSFLCCVRACGEHSSFVFFFVFVCLVVYVDLVPPCACVCENQKEFGADLKPQFFRMF